MKSEFILYIFLNYIILMGITIISILKRMYFFKYIEVIIVVAFCINIIIFCIHKVLTILKDANNSKFELDISSSEEDIKDLLKQVSEEEKQNLE